MCDFDSLNAAGLGEVQTAGSLQSGEARVKKSQGQAEPNALTNRDKTVIIADPEDLRIDILNGLCQA